MPADFYQTSTLHGGCPESKETSIASNDSNSKPKKERHRPRNRKKSNNSVQQEKPDLEVKADNNNKNDDSAPKPSGKVKLLQKQNKGASRLFQMATAPLQVNFSKGRQKCAANFTEKSLKWLRN